MPEQDKKNYFVCQDRQSCIGAYSYDYLRRIKRTPENQGTGNLVNDLRQRLEQSGINAEVKPISCYGYCSKSPVIIVDGKLEPQVYWNKLDDLINNHS